MNTTELADEILRRAKGARRFLVAIAGPPGSGKTTLAEAVAHDINARERGDICAIAAMDGFHLDNETLSQRGLLQVKGAPGTFDAQGFIELVTRLKTASAAMKVPGFDRKRDCVVPDVTQVAANTPIVLVEGNYLLLGDEPWNGLAELFDCTIFVKPDVETLKARLIQRWRDHGLDEESATRRALSNDIPNAMHVFANSAKADIEVDNG